MTVNGKGSFSYNSSVLGNCSKITRSSSTNFFFNFIFKILKKWKSFKQNNIRKSK